MDKQETILVVDDNPDNVEILSAFLESKGYRVAAAADGKSALAKLEEVQPALVLLDVMMPGMDGWQVCRTIKGHPEFGSTRVVNSGSVGMPFGRTGADWLLLGPGVELRNTSYDLADAAERIRATDYPQADTLANSLQHPPSEEQILEQFTRISF